MTAEDLLAYLRLPGAVLAFDTNTIMGNRPDQGLGVELIDCVNQINKFRRAGETIRKVVPAVVFQEKLRHMRQTMQRKRKPFDPSMPQSFIDSKGLDIEDFERTHAEWAAKRLAELYPVDGAWRAFKKRRCLECVGLSPTLAAAAGDGSRCGATVDWLIAAQADMSGYLLVTNDLGPEFASVPYMASVTAAKAAAERLRDEVVAAG